MQGSLESSATKSERKYTGITGQTCPMCIAKPACVSKRTQGISALQFESERWRHISREEIMRGPRVITRAKDIGSKSSQKDRTPEVWLRCVVVNGGSCCNLTTGKRENAYYWAYLQVGSQLKEALLIEEPDTTHFIMHDVWNKANSRLPNQKNHHMIRHEVEI